MENKILSVQLSVTQAFKVAVMYLDLILNLSLLIALSVLSGFIARRWPRGTRLAPWMQGVLFGTAAVIGMLKPLVLGPGLVFDGRSVMISLCTLFHGPIAGGLAALMAILCRIQMGGVGAVTGTLVILSSMGIGLMAHVHLKPGSRIPSTVYLFVFGIAVHLAMLALMLTLPKDVAWQVISTITLPIFLIYPPATILAGKVLAEQEFSTQYLKEMENSRKNLDITLKSIGDAVIATDIKGRVTLMNPVAETLTGWTLKEAQKQPLTEIFRILNAHTRNPVENPVEKVILTGKVEGLANHTLLITKEGQEIQIADSAAPIIREDGLLTGVVLVFRDVREEYRNQEKIKNNEALLREMGHIAHIGAWEYNPERDTLNWTDEVGRIHDLHPEEKISTEKSLSFYTDASRKRLETAIETTLAEKTPFDLELEMFSAQGKHKWVRTIGHPVVLKDRVVQVRGTFQDISRQKQSEEALRASEEDYRRLFEEHAAVKLILDPETGSIVDANASAVRYYGWSREELRSMKIQDINTLPEDAVRKEIERIKKEGRIHFEFQHRRADGSIRDVAIFSSLIRMKNREYLHSIIHDISERKRLEIELRQSQKMEAVGKLAGGIAHDFNNMLGIILGHAELIMGRLQAQDPLIQDLKEIQKAANRSAALTRQLLTFARRQTISPRILYLNDIIENMLIMLRRLIGENIDLQWHPGRDLWRVEMDPSQVDQILVNLTINARDAIRDTGRVTLETANIHSGDLPENHRELPSGDFVVLTVTDNGCGMDSEVMSQLFEPFFTTKALGEGTGLGLSTVYGIVRQNRGFIQVYSEPGEGSSFRIYLPKAKEQTPSQNPRPVSPPPIGQEGILLVEDEPALLKLTTRMLTHLGYRVLAAASPKEALSLAEKYAGEIHLLLTDVIMPEMNGRDLAQHLMEKYPEMKCVFMSGYTANVIAQHGVLQADLHFIQKPFSIKEIADIIKKTLTLPAQNTALEQLTEKRF